MSGFSSPDNIAFTQKNTEPHIQPKETPESELIDAYQLERCISWIKEHNFEKTCLQFPDKLLNDGVAVSLYLQKVLGKRFYLMADTAYGSCCVDHISAQHVNGDSIIHFGHACLSPFSKLPVLYIFEKAELDVIKFKNTLENAIPSSTQVILFYDDVYHHIYSVLCDNFKNSNVQISKLSLPENDMKEDNTRQLFGRIFPIPAEKDSAAVYLGETGVTLQNLALALPDMRWYHYTEAGELVDYELERMKFLMKKNHQVEVVRDAKVIGIVIGTLGIENYLDAIERVKVLAKNQGKKCYIFAVGRPTIHKLANFPEVDVFVSIACPENLSKDFKEYYKPVVSLFEVEMALNNRPFSMEYVNDFREVLKLSPVVETETSEETHVSLTTGRLISHGKSGIVSSSALQEKLPGIVAEARGADFLMNRSWRGLEQNIGDKEVTKVEVGRSGIPQGYENELSTLDETKRE